MSSSGGYAAGRVIKAHRAVPVPGGPEPSPAPAAVVGVPGVESPPVTGGTAGQAETRLAGITLDEARRRAEALETRARLLLAEVEEVVRQRRAEAEAAAAAILEQARAEAAAIGAEAARRGEEEGRAHGRAEGLAAARDEARALLGAAQREAADLLASARREAAALREAAQADREALLGSLEPQLVRLALQIARQILKAEVTLRPDAVVPMLAAALAKVRGGRPRVRLGPDDAARLGPRWAEVAGQFTGGEAELVADPSLAPGEFVLHSDQGTVDGRLDAQLGEVAAALEAGLSLGEGDRAGEGD